jgi:hypothetical protein
MAKGRRRAMWDQIAWGLSPHLPKGANPARLNPYRRRESASLGPTLDVAELMRWRAEVTK